MTELVITRGLPGSGKSTTALQWVADDPKRRVRVNRDTARIMLHGGRLGTREQEEQVTVVTHNAIDSFLKQGLNVIVDDTCLPNKTVKNLMLIAAKHDAEVKILDFTDVPVEECIRRDKLREESVGENVIRDMHTRYLRGKSYPLENPVIDTTITLGRPYVAREGTPKAIIVDIDGTVAKMTIRGPHDYHLVSTDAPKPVVLQAVKDAYDNGYEIVFCSGRKASCRQDTLDWLNERAKEYGFKFTHLFMRETKDNRKDFIIKMELFDKYIRDNFDVRYCLDDRDQVVNMYRGLGLTVFQVDEGNF